MENKEEELQELKTTMLSRFPRFGAEIASVQLEFRSDLACHTAATDGEKIYFDPDFFATLNEEERLFIIAHEVMHIKFEHMYRIKDKDGNMRDMYLWNVATDAIINANLKRDRFTIREGYIDIPGALNYNAEELYDMLLKEKEKKQQEKQQGKGEQQGQQDDGQGKGKNQNKQGQSNNQNKQNQGNNQSQGGGGSNSGQNQDQDQSDENEQNNQNSKGEQGGNQGDSSEQNQNNSNNGGNGNQDKKNQKGEGGQNEQGDGQGEKGDKEGKQKGKGNQKGQTGDDHSLWEKAFEARQEKGKKDGKNSDGEQKDKNEQKTDSNAQEPIDEKAEFEANREQKRNFAKQNAANSNSGFGFSKDGVGDRSVGNVGEAPRVINWKTLLRRELDKEETEWGKRRAIRENNYAYRLEDVDRDEEAETEIMLDVSGSISPELLKAFLRQLKPILKDSKIKVGFFAGYATEKFVEIKKPQDIDKLKVVVPGAGTNMDAAVKAFSKKKEVNKIVFTDGYPTEMPHEDTKNVNVIWIVYENRDFHPCCGKVIDIDPISMKEIKKSMHLQSEGREL